MEIKDQVIQNLLNIMDALELYQQEKNDAWALGALDSLYFMRATLFPLNPEEGVKGLSRETVKALAALDEELKKRFEQKVKECIKQDTMLVKWYGNLFDMEHGSENSAT